MLKDTFCKYLMKCPFNFISCEKSALRKVASIICDWLNYPLKAHFSDSQSLMGVEFRLWLKALSTKKRPYWPRLATLSVWPPVNRGLYQENLFCSVSVLFI